MGVLILQRTGLYQFLSSLKIWRKKLDFSQTHAKKLSPRNKTYLKVLNGLLQFAYFLWRYIGGSGHFSWLRGGYWRNAKKQETRDELSYMNCFMQKGPSDICKKWRSRPTATSLTQRLVLNDAFWHDMPYEQCNFLLCVKYWSEIMYFDRVINLFGSTPIQSSYS
jgi:hypothetical protein